MKKTIYILILILFLSSSFIKGKSLENLLIGNCWVNKNCDNDFYVKRLGFNPNKHGLRFINESEMIFFSRNHWCGNASREQILGVWEVLNDSTIFIKYKNYAESIITSKYRVRKKTNRKVELEYLSSQERKKGENPKPFLD